MLRRALVALILLAIPFQAQAASYTVRPGDTLAAIAARYHIGLTSLARANGIRNPNYIRAGQVLAIPVQSRAIMYHVRWGDTLLGLSARFHLSLSQIHVLNPSLGAYPLAGEWLRLCSPCAGASGALGASSPAVVRAPATGVSHLVQVGENLTTIATAYGVKVADIMATNGIANANLIEIGSYLRIPTAQPSTPGTRYDPWAARAAIVSYAHRYGIDPALPLAIAWQESGFNQSMISPTGAIGVMQVEPYTGAHITDLLGRPFNLHRLDDNIHAGVYWLSVLLKYYGYDEKLAVAAYYEGTKNIARHGLFTDTVQYVNDVLALKGQFS